MDLHLERITMIGMRLCTLDTIHRTVYNKIERKLPDTIRCTLPSLL